MGAAYRGSCTIIIDNNNNNNNKSLFFSAGYRDRTRTAGVLTTTPRTPRKLLVLRFASCVRCHCSTCSLRYACKPFEQPTQVPRKFGLASTQPHRKCYKSAMSSNNRPQALNCEICNQWFHSACQANMTKTKYEFLNKQSTNIHWYCDTCNITASLLMTITNLKVNQDQLTLEVNEIK